MHIIYNHKHNTFPIGQSLKEPIKHTPQGPTNDIVFQVAFPVDAKDAPIGVGRPIHTFVCSPGQITAMM